MDFEIRIRPPGEGGGVSNHNDAPPFSVVFSFPTSKGSSSLDKVSAPLSLGLQIRSPPFVLSISDENLFGIASGEIGSWSSSVFVSAHDLRRTLCRTDEDEEWAEGTGEAGG